MGGCSVHELALQEPLASLAVDYHHRAIPRHFMSIRDLGAFWKLGLLHA